MCGMESAHEDRPTERAHEPARATPLRQAALGPLPASASALLDPLEALLARREVATAHRAATEALRAAPGDPITRVALAAFDLEEASGRRSARRLLRLLRAEAREVGAGGHASAAEDQASATQDQASAAQDNATRAATEPRLIFRPEARAAVEAWAHFRLWRHGRALTLADASISDALRGPTGSGSPTADPAWRAALEAIRRSALRQGYLRVAQRAHHLAARLGPSLAHVERDMEAVAFLLDHHREHSLPPVVARYLARSLGADGEPRSATVALVKDLTLTPAHLEGAQRMVERFGLRPEIGERLRDLGARLFHGRWRARRRAQRAARGLFWGLALLMLILGLLLLQQIT